MSEGGCTSCGNKGGCDHRKTAMFAAIDEALLHLYPSRRFGERDDNLSLDLAPPVHLVPWTGDSAAVASDIAKKLGTLAVELPPVAEEYCRQIYVLCFGRHPCLIEAVHGLASPAREDLENGPLDELYLRVSISDLVPFAAVQQVSMRGQLEGDELMIEEAPRTGVFDPVLLPRMQRLVAVLVDHGLRNLDFGEISAPPPGFDPGDYAQRFGGAPAVANYFFYPQPCSSITTTVVRVSAGGDSVSAGLPMAIATSKPTVVI
jgi:hypothetical protein